MNAALLPEIASAATTTGRPQEGRNKSQVVHLQNLLIKKTLDEELTAKELADVTRAWCSANEERRKLSMKPLPKSVDVTKTGRRHRSSPAQEPAEPSTVE